MKIIRYIVKVLKYSFFSYGIGIVLASGIALLGRYNMIQSIFWVQLSGSMLWLIAGVGLNFNTRTYGSLDDRQKSLEKYIEKVEESRLPKKTRNKEEIKLRESQGMQFTFVGLVLLGLTLLTSYLFKV